MRFSLIGYGVSMREIAKFILKRKMGELFISEKGKLSESDKDMFLTNGIEFEENGNTFKASQADVVVYSPSVRPDNEILQRARQFGAKVMGEMEFSWQYLMKNSNAKIVAITGSNGKTTTVSLLDHILSCANIEHFTGGNIGVASAKYGGEAVGVFEISSFQLMGVEEFHPNISAILNISPNHLDWHKDMKEYVEAKMRLSSADIFLYNADSAYIPPSDGITISKEFGDIFIDEDKESFWVDGVEYSTKKSKLQGVHNLYNAAFSATIASILEVDVNSIAKGIRTFSPLPHRQEFVTDIDGVIYINDSKSTTSESTIAALNRFKLAIIIIGGRPKEKDYTKLAEKIKENSKMAIVMGEMIPMLKNELKGFSFEEAKDLAEAVEIARKVAKKGDTVLFSPAATSFDMFKNYKERGEAFKRIVYAKRNF